MSAPAPTLLPVWPRESAGVALEALARRAGLPARDAPPLARPPAEVVGDPEALDRWLEAAGNFLEVEVEGVSSPYPDVESMILRAGPALLWTPDPEPGLLALLRGERGRVLALGPDLRVVPVDVSVVARALCAPLERPHRGAVTRLLDAAGVAPERRPPVERELMRQLLAGAYLQGCWLLRIPPSAALLPQLRAAGVIRAFGGLLGAHAVEYALLLGAWATLGRGALSGELQLGWLAAWALLLLSAVPFRMVTVYAQGLLSLGFGAVLKRRLLVGALRLGPEEVRHQGAGQLLGRVIESEAVESLALGGGLLAVIALVELAMAGWVLSQGEGGLLRVGLLGVWGLVACGLTALALGARARWTRTRLELTHELVERMVGHRTRLAQQRPERWHEGEDEALTRYLRDGRGMDGWTALTSAVLPRGWMLLGLLGLAPGFVAGEDPAALAVAVGGVMMALGALSSLGAGVSSLGGAWIAWSQVAPLFHAAAREDVRAAPTLLFLEAGGGEQRPVLEAHDLRFAWRPQGEPVLSGVSLVIRRGDRVLLEGPSGGGKSTLASLLVGLRTPGSGLLLLQGLDRATLGSAGWRRRVSAAPQFHENHVLTGTFAFNLLLGRGWPPTTRDLEEAGELCQALGLGPLLDRMPAGLQQMVGETGWQLSHGEKSRLYLARALLQRAELVVLDESFAALDPENLALCLRATLERAPALVVIAHP